MTTDGMGRWVYHGHNGDRGKVRRLKDNLPFAYDRESEQGRRRLENLLALCVRVRCCRGKWWAKPHTFLVSPTHPYGRKETEATQGDKMQTGR